MAEQKIAVAPAPPDLETRKHLGGLRIAVLHGGPGVEREVSLWSGRNAAAALAPDCPDLRVVDVRGPEDLEGLEADVALMMLHGEFGEDGQAQDILDQRGIPHTGSRAGACRKAIDKDAAKRLMAAAGVPVAPWALLRNRGLKARDGAAKESDVLEEKVRRIGCAAA